MKTKPKTLEGTSYIKLRRDYPQKVYCRKTTRHRRFRLNFFGDK